MINNPVYQHVTLEISNVAAGQRVEITLIPIGNMITWSSGPFFGSHGPGYNYSGVELYGLSGMIPIAEFIICPLFISIVTAFASGYSGESITFSIRLFLEADPEIQTFSLKSTSDPGVLISVQNGNTAPVMINSSETQQFSWDTPPPGQ